MRNLQTYNEDTLTFYKKVVDSKNITKADPAYKIRLALLETGIKKQYLSFDKHFVNNTLEELTNETYSQAQKNDLLSLYSYKSKIIQDLKIKVTTTEKNRIISTCQNCTIGEVNSFDHLIPKGAFSEFAINPKNLFPSCSKCNSLKNITWLEDGKRVFLNLYLDNLPREQYLFVKIGFAGNLIETKFDVRNEYSIEPNLFELIRNHYLNLNLFQRFNENIDSVITPLINAIEPYRKRLLTEEIKESALFTARKNMLVFGSNYWKSILEISLLEDEEFVKRYIS